ALGLVLRELLVDDLAQRWPFRVRACDLLQKKPMNRQELYTFGPTLEVNAHAQYFLTTTNQTGTPCITIHPDTAIVAQELRHAEHFSAHQQRIICRSKEERHIASCHSVKTHADGYTAF